jgi:hypothetical protein
VRVARTRARQIAIEDFTMTPDPSRPLANVPLGESSLLSELEARGRAHQEETAALARDAADILARHEAQARDTAERLVTEARLEAARLVTDARREAATLAAQVELLRRAQQEAAHALQQTRLALDSALGAASERHDRPRASVVPMPSRPHVLLSPFEQQAARGGDEALSTPPSTHGRLAGTRSRWRARHVRWIAGAALAAAAVAVIAIASGPLRGLVSGSREPSPSTGIAGEADGDSPRESAGQQPAAGGAAAEVIVRLEAQRASWVRATVDGRSEKGSTLAPGQTRQLEASDHIVIRTGDAGALLVSVNGAAPRPFGRDGQVTTRRFGRTETAALAARPDRATDVPSASTGTTPPEARAAAEEPLAAAALSGGLAAEAMPPVGTSVAVAAPPVAPSRPSTRQTAEQQILDADRQWFEAYYRNDRTTVTRLSAEGFAMTDARSADRRTPPGSEPARQVRDVRVDVHGDGAVLSGRMIERVAHGTEVREHESFVSEVWVRRDGTWRLLGLRLATPEEVRRAAAPLASQ